jgi:hypothetical protein
MQAGGLAALGGARGRSLTLQAGRQEARQGSTDTWAGLSRLYYRFPMEQPFGTVFSYRKLISFTKRDAMN